MGMLWGSLAVLPDVTQFLQSLQECGFILGLVFLKVDAILIAST